MHLCTLVDFSKPGAPTDFKEGEGAGGNPRVSEGKGLDKKPCSHLKNSTVSSASSDGLHQALS